jgi:cytochrome b6-f complex iron-sulfur subunit
MADDNEVKRDEPKSLPPIGSSKPVGGAKTLPPLTSAKPVGGAKLPPLASAKPVGVAATTPAPTAKPVAPQQPVQPASSPIVPTTHAVSTPPAPQPRAAAVPKAEPRKAKQDKPPENDNGIWRMSRKNFLNVAGWFGFISFLVTATLGAIRLMVPRVLYEAPSAFKAGFPEDYIIGEVNEKYKDEFRVWIVRDTEGFYALSAICTHLGCTPRWAPSENKFKCPCHGSGYHKDGVNFEGPTPRPLERLKITLADDGQILIDRNIKFLYEKQEWSKPDAFLKYS